MNISGNLASKFRRKQMNQVFLQSAMQICAEMKPDSVILCTNSVLDERLLAELNESHRLIMVTNDANRCLQLLDSGITIEHYSKKSDVQEDLVRDIVFMLLNSKKITESSSVLFLYSKNDWDCFSQILYLELGNIAEANYLRSLSSLTHIAPLHILETVIEIALELGREGREGKPIGTILVIGDHKKVLQSSRSLVFNPFKGYTVKERDILKQEVRDSVKEMAKIDGALVISDRGIVQAGGQYLDFRATDIQVGPGLGSRHTAAAAVSKGTTCMAVAISESTGVVRAFVNGEVFLQINPRQNSPIRL